ncbi:nicotinamide riboside transporter PnuC [Bacilliculturomica massiliensis]|uniref:nicotinamide riboside transporter PnuC n=1 Tax=Bacilliculturomica massiliensis TaxID=1917867 RepID=UPI0010318C79|nr:nicotinamide riboside transporter PnuC [Bacilliculturomica massiliensis]
MGELLRSELRGWKVWEVLWLITAATVITALSVYWKDDLMGIICAATGVICVVCTGKGKLSAYLFGAVNTLLYAIIAWNARFYGEVMLNALYYFPLQFYGFYVWSKHIDPDTGEVEKKRMTARCRGALFAGLLAAAAAYGLLLERLGGSLPYVDALSTTASVAAMMISVKMYAEQWILWIAVDIVTVFMWAFAFAGGNDSIATLLMWIVYLGNAVIMYVKWNREAKRG